MEDDTVAVDTCIGWMVPHTLPTGCKRLRYDGVQVTKTCTQVQVRSHAALAKVEGGQGCHQAHRPADLAATVCAEDGSRSFQVSPLARREGGVGQLAPDLWGHL